ncbi:MAG: RimK family alpha-L-glutamate ligase [Deltaproteobacteria bacterium]|nr:RimK family alpha-L-glutamate ligase [Deltaproteobacteria bacterium]MCL5791899.1 RimK family alpha-L-glutamate ligase [Deltaproteobacteria bacterium]
MRILILSKRLSIYSTKRLAQAARSHGHSVRVIDPLKLNIAIVNGKKIVKYKGKDVKKPDIIIPRISGNVNSFSLAAVKQYEQTNTVILNNPFPISIARDKFMSIQYLLANGVDVPATAMIRNPEDIDSALSMVGGPPVILKLIEGLQGIGVILAESRDSIESTINAFFSLGQNIILQQFISESKGRDIRIFVVGGNVVGAIKRIAKSGEFRTNIHRGANAESIILPDSYKEIALKAASTIGLDIAGVDIIESSSGPKVLEVNPSPGFEAIEKITKSDIALEIIKYAESKSKL